MILGLLSMCLFVFGYSDKIESVSASSVCIQECEASEALCYDSCSTSCTPDSTDEECNGCIQSCQRSFGSCMRHAIWCNSGGSSYAPSCQIGFADHCPVINGEVHCEDPSTHAGYYSICTTIGNQQCVNCPDHSFCQGANGLPPCY